MDFDWLSDRMRDLDAGDDLIAKTVGANTANEVLGHALAAGVPVADTVANHARRTAIDVIGPAPVQIEVLVVDRGGAVVGRAGGW